MSASEELLSPCPENGRIRQTPFTLSENVFYGQPLMHCWFQNTKFRLMCGKSDLVSAENKLESRFWILFYWL